MSSDCVCQNCGAQATSTFYEVRNVPVHTCVMMSTRQEALRFPKGKIVLGFCQECGFVSNVAFDSSAINYSSIYEDQQCFSSTFNAFAEGLAKRLIEKYNLHGKEILEIGCGKGDFLALLCELGHNHGVGIDPAYIKDRIHSKASDRLTFIRDYYSERYANYHGDLICCRHTLEHIPNTAEFLSSVRRAIGNRLDTIVFFEVPDSTRILRELAFWDIYHEHCSYFSPGSIARLFRSCQFDIIDLSKDFDDQYILIEAKPVNRKAEKVHELEESVEELAKDITYFATHCREKLDQWKKRLHQIYADERRAVVWGSGSKCVSFMTTLGVKDEIEYVIDINPFRHGKYLPGIGKKIMPPEFLRKYKPDVVIVMNPIYYDEIHQMLNDMDLTPEVISV
jgi:SAM-dependent methyltransferase